VVGKRLVESGEIWDMHQEWTNRSSAAVSFCSLAMNSKGRTVGSFAQGTDFGVEHLPIDPALSVPAAPRKAADIA